MVDKSFFERGFLGNVSGSGLISDSPVPVVYIVCAAAALQETDISLFHLRSQRGCGTWETLNYLIETFSRIYPCFTGQHFGQGRTIMALGQLLLVIEKRGKLSITRKALIIYLSAEEDRTISADAVWLSGHCWRSIKITVDGKGVGRTSGRQSEISSAQLNSGTQRVRDIL